MRTYLSRENFWSCSHEYGVCEIKNITPKSHNDIEFQNALNSVGLSKEKLERYDYVIRKTNTGAGSGKVPSKSTRVELIKVNKKSGIGDIRNVIMDNDLLLFSESGLGLFSSKEAAERCVKFANGDIEKYAQYLTNKTSSKYEKNTFADSMKSAALVGAGAAVPKIFDYLVKKTTKPKVEVAMGIMKPFIPPIAASAGAAASTSFVGGTASSSLFGGILTGIATVSKFLVPAASLVLAGISIYNFAKETEVGSKIISTVVGFFGNLWNGIKNLFGIGENALHRLVEPLPLAGVSASCSTPPLVRRDRA